MVTNTSISTLSILQDHEQGSPLTDGAIFTSIHTSHVSEFKIKVSLNVLFLADKGNCDSSIRMHKCVVPY